MNGNRTIDLDFGPTARCTSPTTAGRTSRSPTPTTPSGASPTSAAPTPRVPTRRSPRTEPASHDVRVQHRQVRRRLLQVGLLRRRHVATGRTSPHVHVTRGNGVNDHGDADRDLRRRPDLVEDDRRPDPDDGAARGHRSTCRSPRPDARRRRPTSAASCRRRQHLRGDHHGQRRLDDAERRADDRRPGAPRARASWSTDLGTPLASRRGRRTPRNTEHRVRRHHGEHAAPAAGPPGHQRRGPAAVPAADRGQ